MIELTFNVFKLLFKTQNAAKLMLKLNCSQTLRGVTGIVFGYN